MYRLEEAGRREAAAHRSAILARILATTGTHVTQTSAWMIACRPDLPEPETAYSTACRYRLACFYILVVLAGYSSSSLSFLATHTHITTCMYAHCTVSHNARAHAHTAGEFASTLRLVAVPALALVWSNSPAPSVLQAYSSTGGSTPVFPLPVPRYYIYIVDSCVRSCQTTLSSEPQRDRPERLANAVALECREQ